MRTLETLIKRVKKDIDALSVEAGRAQAAKNDIIAEQAMQAASLEAEAGQFDGSPMTALGMAAYFDRQKARRAQLATALDYAEKAYEECQKALTSAFAELKRLEHLVAQEKLRARHEAEKAEQAAFDERSAQQAGRRSY
ncbi:MAG: hypothetical protein CMK09_16530 [Ponticaulis sp.]|nr:hypothetical protein [Ponticaulis sp.]|tara:strand:+ start:7861 stop:8277 length:417 start_codon:yes stop_codon:yes gene_type:complete